MTPRLTVGLIFPISSNFHLYKPMRRWRLNTSHELANVLVLHRHGHGTQRSLSPVLNPDNNPELRLRTEPLGNIVWTRFRRSKASWSRPNGFLFPVQRLIWNGMSTWISYRMRFIVQTTKIVADGTNSTLCTSHDLATPMAKLCGIRNSKVNNQNNNK